MKKIFILFLALIALEIVFAQADLECRRTADFEFKYTTSTSGYEFWISNIINKFREVDFSERNTLVRKLQIILAQDIGNYLGNFSGLLDINTREAIKNLQRVLGFPTTGLISEGLLRNIFPDCRIRINEPSGEILLNRPVAISWSFGCLPFFGDFVTNEALATFRILRMMQVNLYLVPTNCSEYNSWWYLDNKCNYLYLGRAPITTQSFIWTPRNIATGTYTIRLIPLNFQIFQQDVGPIGCGLAKLYAKSAQIKIVAPANTQETPPGPLEIPTKSL